MMTSESQFYFAKSHEWISKNSDGASHIGISDFAQSELGDVVYILLPEVGKTYQKGDKIGEIESVKSVSEIYAPVSLKVISANSALNEKSELINSDPYDAGYIAKIEMLNPSDISDLMDKSSYESFVSSSHA